MAPPSLDPAWTAKRFDAAILPQLEAHVDAQCASQSYDLEPNLAVLKLYQFHPETLKVPVVAKILVKALMNLPETDFLACTYLIPERVLDQDPIKAIVGVAAQLERCSFREVWELLTPLRGEVLAATPGFDDAVRAFVLKTFEITYQSAMPRPMLRSKRLWPSAAGQSTATPSRSRSTRTTRRSPNASTTAAQWTFRR